MKVKLYIIKRVSDGAHLPAGRGRNGRGFTHQEPVPPEMAAIWPPRLFHEERAAKQALSWWLSGVTTVCRRSGGGWDYYECDEDWHTEHKPDRVKEDWAVVPATLEY